MHTPGPISFHITCRWPDLRPVSMATSGLEGGPARWTPETVEQLRVALRQMLTLEPDPPPAG